MKDQENQPNSAATALTRRDFIASVGVGVLGVSRLAEAAFAQTIASRPTQSPYTTGLPVTTRRFLFLDDTIVEDMENLRRNFHQIRRRGEKPLIVPDGPGDQLKLHLYGNVFRDMRDNSFHIWYHSNRFNRDGQRYLMSYARSTDGLHWEKPKLNLVEIDGSKANNVVAKGYVGAYTPGLNLIHCPDERDPNKRFRRIYQMPDGYRFAYSPDGIVWDNSKDFAFQGSDAACVIYDQLRRRFLGFSIAEPPNGRFPRVRTPVVATSDDCKKWSDFQIAFKCDELDNKLVIDRIEQRRAVLSYGIRDHFHEEVNNMLSFNYADMMVGIPVMFDCCGYDVWKGTPGGRGSGKDDCVTHLQLAWCRDRDAREWARPAAREPFLEITDPPRWDCGFVTAAESPVRVEDELWFYYAGENISQQHPVNTLNDGWRYKQGDVKSGISVATLRLDGFASLDADRQGGLVITKPIEMTAAGIFINSVVYHGLVVELLNEEQGKVIAGYGVEDCVPIVGDSVRHELKYKNASVVALAGKKCRLRFRLSGGMLFSFSTEA